VSDYKGKPHASVMIPSYRTTAAQTPHKYPGGGGVIECDLCERIKTPVKLY